jgi:hypothetical protein
MAKKLESSSRMEAPPNLREQLESALQEINALTRDRQSGGFVSGSIIKAEFEIVFTQV